MSKKQIEEKNKIKKEIHITYYFSVLFTIIGTLAILYLLSHKVEKISLFTVMLSISAGGLPIGFIGALIDYKISEYKVKYNKTVN
ncbi:hypothetical protein [Bacillus sp. FJAT-22090]|uniref:hypothetical protein n=1 Tax=Bacillus sp. FJAT-22090 TaxID=1581038 RepID=UPI0011A07840|nr:hypothetical protein [Bacillus sp. FJAT-22090]